MINGLRMVSIFWACSPISFKHMSFWCPFLDPHLIIYHWNIDVHNFDTLEYVKSNLTCQSLDRLVSYFGIWMDQMRLTTRKLWPKQHKFNIFMLFKVIAITICHLPHNYVKQYTIPNRPLLNRIVQWPHQQNRIFGVLFIFRGIWEGVRNRKGRGCV